MKRIVFMALAVLVGLCCSANDRFYIEDFTLGPGETCNVSILLDNEMAYTAFQSDLYLPEGLTATNFALTDRKNSNHTLTATVLPDGGIRLLSYSLKLKTYSGNSGALVTFDFIACDNFVGDATIRLQGTIFTTSEGIEVPFDDETCTVMQTTTGLLGDVNDDGVVNITDVTVLINAVMTESFGNINTTNADMNGDGIINITDVTMLINTVMAM